jgi:opacity protein-like surface antigen
MAFIYNYPPYPSKIGWLSSKKQLIPLTAKYIISILCLCLAIAVQAQSLSVGGFVGICNYSGDLTPSYWELSEMHPAIGINGTWSINRYLSLRGALQYGAVSGSDEHATNNLTRERNLHFKSSVLEGSAQVLIDFLGNHRRFIPYIYIGISAFHFAPRAQYQGEWVALQPLGTEGQGLSQDMPRLYRLWANALALGGGLRYALNDTWQMGMEAGYRRTNTDYLDDISTDYFDNDLLREKRGNMAADLADRSTEYTADKPPYIATTERGNPKIKDGYFWVGFTANYAINKQRKGEKYYCPTF